MSRYLYKIHFTSSLFSLKNNLIFLFIFILSQLSFANDENKGYITVISDYIENVYDFNEGVALVKFKNGTWDYIDKTGTRINIKHNRPVTSFREGFAAIYDRTYKFIDRTGNISFDKEFEDVRNGFYEGLAEAKQSGMWGYIDHTGEFVIPPQFEKTRSFRNGLAPVQKNQLWGYIDKTGTFIISPQFEEAYIFQDNLAPAKKNGKWGFIDKTGNFVVLPQFEELSPLYEGLARAKQNKLWGYIDKSGKFIISPQFHDAGFFYDGLAYVKNNDPLLYGYIDKTGEFVIPPQFDKARVISDGLAAVKINSSWYFICPDNLPAYITARIGTFEDFLNSKGIIKPTDESLRIKIEKEISVWQKKGEFEPTDKWKQRVNDASRSAKAREIAEKVNNDYITKMQSARDEYADTYQKVLADFCSHRSNQFNNQTFTLQQYDADNQTYLISTSNYGDILLPVPLEEAPDFKKNWDNIKRYHTSAKFVPLSNDVALKEVHFDKYTYDSNTKAEYAQIDIDYNFKPIDVTAIGLNIDIPDNSQPSVAMLSTPDATVVTPHKINPDYKKIKTGNVSEIDTDIPSGDMKASNTFAVVIANSNYANASKVINAENDGRVMAQYLAKTLGLPEKNITTYINATYGLMASAVGYLQDISEAFNKSGFNVIFYYVGHGLPDDENRESYLLPVDVDPRNIEVCYPLKKLYSQLGSLGAESVTVMVDACFSGSNHGDGMLIPQSMGVKLKPKETNPTGNMVVMTAAQGDETAYPYDAQGHSLFTYWILKKLHDSKGNVTLGELNDYVTDNVRKTSVIENRKPQTPAVAVSPTLMDSWRSLRIAK